jgi:hypothetical protein
MEPRFQHKLNWLSQFFDTSNIAITGGYHYGNLGDMAMGISVKEFLAMKGIGANLQTIYNFNSWPNRKFTILGGGAIGYKYSLDKVHKKLKGNYDNLGILGVDFNEPTYPDYLLEMLSKAAFVSTRSQSQKDQLNALLNRQDIVSIPDIAFAYKVSSFSKMRSSINEKKYPPRLLINIVPLYGQLKGDILIPSKQYELERPEIIKNHSDILASYIELIQYHVHEALRNNIEVIHIPFTPSDEAYAKLILKDKKIFHLPYSSNPESLLYRINSTDQFLSTRFHATLFGMRGGAKVLPIAYAHKNEELLKELGWETNEYYQLNQLDSKTHGTLEFKRVDENLIEAKEIAAEKGIMACLSKLKLINDGGEE